MSPHKYQYEGLIQDSMLGGTQYWKHKVYVCERRRREAMLGGIGHATPDFFFKKEWRNSKHSGAFYGPMAPSKFCCF